MCKEPEGYANMGRTYFFGLVEKDSSLLGAAAAHIACHLASTVWKSVLEATAFARAGVSDVKHRAVHTTRLRQT